MIQIPDCEHKNKQSLTHEFWMRQALTLASQAADQDETPIGALIIKQGKIIGRGFNRRETDQDVTMHAEMIAIREASTYLGSWRLDDCVLYVTLEPCIMCAGAIIQSRLPELVYGASDPKAGAAGSVTNVFSLQLNHQVEVMSGVLADPCGEILRDFFRKLRQRNKRMGSRARRRQQAISDRAEKSAEKPAIESQQNKHGDF